MGSGKNGHDARIEENSTEENSIDKCQISGHLPIACPWSTDQVLAIVGFILAVSAFYGVIVPALATKSGRWIAITFFHALLVCVTLGCWLWITSINPAATPSTVALAPTKQVLNPFCGWCDAYYACQRRRHCFRCGRCVEGFDHHCSYLNTCISDSTYRVFLAEIGTLFAIQTCQLGMYTFVFAEFFGEDASGLRTFFEEHYGGVGFPMVWVGLSMCVALVAVCGLTYLIGFHLHLALRGQSTIEYLHERFPKIAGYADQTVEPPPAELEMHELYPQSGEMHELYPSGDPPLPEEWLEEHPQGAGKLGAVAGLGAAAPVWSSTIHVDMAPDEEEGAQVEGEQIEELHRSKHGELMHGGPPQYHTQYPPQYSTEAARGGRAEDEGQCGDGTSELEPNRGEEASPSMEPPAWVHDYAGALEAAPEGQSLGGGGSAKNSTSPEPEEGAKSPAGPAPGYLDQPGDKADPELARFGQRAESSHEPPAPPEEGSETSREDVVHQV